MQENNFEELQALRQHLSTISRTDLESYVIQFLPPEEIRNMRLAAPKLNEQEADKLRKQLRLREEDLSLRSIYDEDFMNQSFELLRPYATHNPHLVIRIAKTIIEQLDQALQKGCLFDLYEQEVGFELSEETEFLATVCLAQKEPQATTFLIELLDFYRQLKFADDMEFSFPATLVNRVKPYRDHSLRTLQQILQPSIFELLPLNIQQMIVEDNYERIPEEQQLSLFSQFYTSNVHIAIRLAKLQLDVDQITDARQTLDHYREQHITRPSELPKLFNDSRLSKKWYPLRFRISEKEQDTETAWAVVTAFIHHFQIEGLKFGLSVFPGRQDELESILRESVAGYQYIGYLKQHQRIDDIIALVKDKDASLMPGERNDVYTSYPKHFRKKALYLWYASLDGKPDDSTKKHYRLVIDILEKINAYEEPEKFKALIQSYRDNFKKNTRFLRMLELKGW